VSANRDSIAIHTLQRKWADAEVRAEAAESALQVARDERDEARSEVDDKSEVGHRVADAWQAKAEAAESSLRVARDALREALGDWLNQADDVDHAYPPQWVENVRALLAPEVSPE
jgi:alkylation response protein AidB-like acyl-CoA dehydrogenase